VLAAAGELERLLAEMRGPEPRLRRQVLAWFVEVERRGRWERRRRGDKRRRFSPLVYRRFVVRRPYADRALAMEGVGWLAERWALRDLRGELVEPYLLAAGVDTPRRERLLSAHSGLVRPETA
jgi:hypothetical protein